MKSGEVMNKEAWNTTLGVLLNSYERLQGCAISCFFFFVAWWLN